MVSNWISVFHTAAEQYQLTNHNVQIVKVCINQAKSLIYTHNFFCFR